MNYIVSFALLIVAISGPKLISQGRYLWALESRYSPANLERVRAPFSFERKLSDQVRNCEDVVLDRESGYAILSCNPTRDIWNSVMVGRSCQAIRVFAHHQQGVYQPHEKTEGALYLFDYAGRHDEQLQKIKLADYPLDGKDFHPLGLDYHSASQTLYVVNLGRHKSAVEVFTLYTAEATATHVRTIKHAHLPSPNSIHAIDEKSFYVTNDHYFPHRQNVILNQIETFGGLPISTVDRITFTQRNVDVQTVARQPFPNGIAKVNDTTYAVASTSTGAVQLYDVQGDGKWTRKASIPVPMMPDNLSVDEEGVLFITGHAHPTSILNLAKIRAACATPEGRESGKCTNATSPSMVLSWTETGGLQNIYTDDEFSAACTAVRDAQAKVGIVSSLYGEGVLVWEEA